MTDELAPAQPDSLSERPGPPPLRIHHLLLCTVVASTLLACVHSQRNSGIQWGNTEADWVQIAVSDIVLAAGSTLGALLIYWRVRGYDALSQPGQWLLIPFLWHATTPWPLMFIDQLFSAGSFHGKEILLWNLSDVMQFFVLCINDTVRWIIPAMFYVVAARRAADTRPWRVYLAIVALRESWIAFFQLLATTAFLIGSQPPVVFGLISQYLQPITLKFVFGTLLSLITPATLIWPCIDDRVRRRPRYWTHWAGVILCLAMASVMLARSFAM
jgi:hypothetical protein